MALTSWCCPVLRAKVGRRIRQRGFLVAWCHPNLESSDLRRLRSDVRSGRVLGAVLCPSCASWSHCRDSHADQRCSDVWGRKPCSSNIQTGNRHFERLLTLIRDLQKCEIPWSLPLLQAVQCYLFQGNWKQMTPSPFNKRTSDFWMIWDSVATCQGSAILS